MENKEKKFFPNTYLQSWFIRVSLSHRVRKEHENEKEADTMARQNILWNGNLMCCCRMCNSRAFYMVR